MEQACQKPADLLKVLDLPTSDQHQYQLPVSQLVDIALAKNEGVLAENGALVVKTGKYTGRSPDDRYIVDTPDVHADIDWGQVNRPIGVDAFNRVLGKAKAYLNDKELYVFDGFSGADPHNQLSVRFITELASHNLFVHQLFIRPNASQLEAFIPEFTVICAPGLKLNAKECGVHSEAAIMLNFEQKIVLIVGTQYAGEMKKSIFSVMNYRMPKQNVFPMHCSVNVGQDNRSAVFFGLSGTGKTTLSADPERTLVGDDEHGWGENGLFNFEGGCYAKAIRLSPVTEPEIYQAIRFGALAENVVLDADNKPNYDDSSLTENTRIAYPIDYIPNASPTGMAPHPSTIIFLTADSFGVLPAISKLTAEQAAYHFINGYTSKVAGTERGVTEPKAVFSSCFGAPFMPLAVSEYAALLQQRIQEHQVDVYLVNTGWQGGAYGVGKRISIPFTRAMITAALSGELAQQTFETEPVFNLQVPVSCPGLPAEILNPRGQWKNPTDYDQAAEKLAALFKENFKRHSSDI
jgi:phosphoenolpyruvate carboxykinase (ATP)